MYLGWKLNLNKPKPEIFNSPIFCQRIKYALVNSICKRLVGLSIYGQKLYTKYIVKGKKSLFPITCHEQFAISYYSKYYVTVKLTITDLSDSFTS